MCIMARESKSARPTMAPISGKRRLGVICLIATCLIFLFLRFSSDSATILSSKAPCQRQIKWSECATDAYSAEKQQKAILKDSKNPLPKCDKVGLCVCPQDYLFNGVECTLSKPWEDYLEVLKAKWKQIPFKLENYGLKRFLDEESNTTNKGNGDDDRQLTDELADLTPQEAVRAWKNIRPRDCFTLNYVERFKGLRVLDVGSGGARQSMQFSLQAESVTFLDIVQSNLNFITKVAEGLGVRSTTNFVLFDKMENLDNLPGAPFDAITAFGSMHHMPHELQQKELARITTQLKVGGTWLQLAYPISRWENIHTETYDKTFSAFGKATDGSNTPWGEWYEPGKLLKVLEYGGAKFQVNWCALFNTDEFIWFELTRIA